MRKRYFRNTGALAILAMGFLIIAPLANADLLGGGATPPPTAPPAETPPVTPPVITPPADTTPPVISGIANASVSDFAATIVWLTDEAAISTFEYGTTTSYGSTSILPTSALLAHTAILTSLASGTTYYYCIHATDLFNNSSSACGQSFTTAAPAADITPPTISAIVAAGISSSSETITWTTSELADGQIEYGATTGYGSTTTLNSTLGLTHGQTLSSLTSSTLYHYRILSKDVAGNLTTSSDQTFTTGAAVSGTITDTTAPIVSGVANSELGSNNASIVWTTNELATSTLQYGTTTSYGSQAALGPDALLAHSAVLINLAPSTTYYYCIHATDLFNNTTNSCGHQFSTEAAGVLNQTSGDTTPPVISGVANASVTDAAATIVWTTDELAGSSLEYGTTTSYGSHATVDPTLLLAHSAALTGLSPNTTYYYCIHATDLAANTTNDCGLTFITAQITADLTAPALSTIVAAAVSPTSETISWTTNELADSQIEYGASTNYGATSSVNSTPALSHVQTLNNLTPGTTYHYRVLSKDPSGNLRTSGDFTFTTESAFVNIPAVAAPIISAVNISTAQTGATVTWTTDIQADSHIEYGLNTAYDNQTTESAILTTSHSQIITNLAPGTTYDLRILSQGSNSDEAVSANYIFTTQASSNSGPAVLPSAPTSLWTTDIEQSAVTVNFSVANTAQNEALQYDIRYSTAPITANNFSAATPASETVIYFDFPESGDTATNQYLVLGLNPATKYYFAIKTKDQSGNISPISQVVSATTALTNNNSGSNPNNNTNNEIIENPLTNSSAGSPSSSGPTGSGGNGTYFVGGINAPTNARVNAADAAAILFWDNPSDSNFIRVQLVRSTVRYPHSINDGQVIYEGSQAGFTDINLANGKKYYYSVFAFNHLSHISAPLQFSVTPKAGVEQIDLLKHPGFAECNGQNLSFGMQSDAVKQLQQYLDALNSVTYPQNLITGYFHKYTLSAVKQLQARYGLPQTGVWDAATRAAVGICFNTAPAAPTNSLNRDLQFGDRGNDVSFLQQYLVNLKLLNPKYATRFFGTFTKAGVIQLQQNNNIQPANGIVSAATRNLILNSK